jgi:hypothetical protein
MEENAVKYEERLAVAVTNLAKTSLDADRSQKVQNRYCVISLTVQCIALLYHLLFYQLMVFQN